MYARSAVAADAMAAHGDDVVNFMGTNWGKFKDILAGGNATSLPPPGPTITPIGNSANNSNNTGGPQLDQAQGLSHTGGTQLEGRKKYWQHCR